MSVPDLLPDSTSPSLLLGTIQGSPIATEQLYRIYYPLCFAWCRQLGLQECDALDTAQMVLLRVIDRLGEFSRKKGRFRNWLWTINKNAVFDCCRQGKWEKEYPHDILDRLHAAPDESTRSTLPRIIATQVLEVLKEELTERTFRIVKATICDGRLPADVAAEFGVSVGSVYTAQCRALKKVRLALKDLEF
ncbi:MAG: sigma-70 family RNA polymerase sigma factor [Planctomycetales bacterium]|nr:sigma-70 family RNA polymerase sigma factor [Planctomycetales bacterium]